MTPIFRCVCLLKIPLKLHIKPVWPNCCLQSSRKHSTKKCMNKAFPVGPNDILPIYIKTTERFLKKDLTKSSLFISLLASKRLIATKNSSKHFKPLRQVENKRKSKKPEISNAQHTEFEKSEKKVAKVDDIKFNVNLNNSIHEMMKNHACRKMEQINKLRHFIFKPTNCTPCTKKSKSKSKFGHQKRFFSVSRDERKLVPNDINKRRDIRQFRLALKNDEILYPFFSDYKSPRKQNKTMLLSEGIDFTKGGIVPLYLLVKSNSRRNKICPSVTTTNFQYQVGTNHAFVPLQQKKTFDTLSKDTKQYMLSTTKSNDSFCEKYSLSLIDKHIKVGIKPKNEVKNKLQEIFLRPFSKNCIRFEEKQRSDQEINYMLTDIVKKALTPLLCKEHLKYSEVKKAIERLEKKMECCLEKQTAVPDENIKRSLSNLYNLLIRQNQYDSKRLEIKDPKPNLVIKEPHPSNINIKDPYIVNYSKTLPPLLIEEVKEPYEKNVFECKNKEHNHGGCNNNKNQFKKNEDSCRKEEKNGDLCQMKKNNSSKKKETVLSLKIEKSEDLCDKSKNTKDFCEKKNTPDINFTKEFYSNKKKNEESYNVKKTELKLNIRDKTFSKQNQENGSCEKMPKPNLDFVLKKDANYSCLKEDTCKSNTTSMKGTACSEEKNDRFDEIYRKKDRPCSLEVVKVYPCVKKRICNSNDGKPAHQKNYEVSSGSGLCEKKPMGPSEIICKENDYSPKDCCKNVEICRKKSIKNIEPKCCDNQHIPAPNRRKRNQHIEIPSKATYIPIPVQKPCDAPCHKPTEPPNCCKTLPNPTKQPPNEFQEMLKSQITEKHCCKQSPCPKKLTTENILKNQEETKSLDHQSTSASPTISKESFFNYLECEPKPPKVKADHSVYGAVKSVSNKPKSDKKIETENNKLLEPQSLKPAVKESQQTQKKNWLPFKLKFGSTKQQKNSCALNTDRPTSQDNSKISKNANGVIDHCKGFFRSVCSLICPSKYNPKKKADGIIRYHSLSPMIQGKIDTSPCILPGSGDNSGYKKNIPIFFTYNMKVKNKYPWNKNQDELHGANNFSTESTGISKIIPRIQSLNAIKFELPTDIFKKFGRKTLAFRLVHQKSISGFTTAFDKKNHPRSFRFVEILEAQKRKVSDIPSKKAT